MEYFEEAMMAGTLAQASRSHENNQLPACKELLLQNQAA